MSPPGQVERQKEKYMRKQCVFSLFGFCGPLFAINPAISDLIKTTKTARRMHEWGDNETVLFAERADRTKIGEQNIFEE